MAPGTPSQVSGDDERHSDRSSDGIPRDLGARGLTLALVGGVGFAVAYAYLVLTDGLTQQGRLIGAFGALFIALTTIGVGLLVGVLRRSRFVAGREDGPVQEFPGPPADGGQLDVAKMWSHDEEEKLREFTFLVAHDLREPARTAATHARLAQREAGEDLSDQAQEDIETAIWAAKRMDELLSDLLTYVSLGEPEIELVDLEETLDDALMRLAAGIDRSQATVEAGSLGHVHADRSHVAQLIEELVSNAIKFVPDGREPYVEIRCEETDGGWVLEVADNGIGIDPDHAERAFSMFERLHDRTRFPGTGAGLAICRRIVALHGGEIRLETQPGQGTAFHIHLPRVDTVPDGTQTEEDPVASDRGAA